MQLLLFFIIGAIIAGAGVLFLTTPTEDSVSEPNTTQETSTDTKENQNTVSDQDTKTQDGSRLDLSGRQLTTAPGYIFEQTQLTYLDLSDNQLTGALQAEVRHLKNLTTLDLSNNQFTGVPAEVGQLSKLRMLDLSNNQLTGLPHEIANLKNLETLDLRGNSPSDYDLTIIKEALQNTTILTD